MKVEILGEAGYEFALLGIGKSFGVSDIERLNKVAYNLCDKDGGHNKFLESMVVWLEITASRYVWQEFDTYRVGTTKQSESTIHTITKTPLTQESFNYPVLQGTIDYINGLIMDYKKESTTLHDKKLLLALIKNELPEGFLQTRIVCTNYKVIRNIIHQRKNHVLDDWHTFIQTMLDKLEHADLLKKGFNYEY